MQAGGLFRLCLLCKRVVSRVGHRSAPWRTGEGHSGGASRLLHTDWIELYERESVQNYLQKLVQEHGELSRRLQHARLNEADRKAAARRHGELQPVTAALQRLEAAARDLQEVEALLDGSSGAKDEDLTALLKEEEAHISRRMVALREELIRLLVPDDPLDGSDVMLEVVSGRTTGGQRSRISSLIIDELILISD